MEKMYIINSIVLICNSNNLPIYIVIEGLFHIFLSLISVIIDHN